MCTYWWLSEFRFDGFRFDGITSMLYKHHGIGILTIDISYLCVRAGVRVCVCVRVCVLNDYWVLRHIVT